MVKHLNIKVYGRVQGVFFRYSAKDAAEKLSVKGFARNEDISSVYIEAEGEEENLDQFLNWCKNGPPHAKVEKIDVSESELKNFSEFEVY